MECFGCLPQAEALFKLYGLGEAIQGGECVDRFCLSKLNPTDAKTSTWKHPILTRADSCCLGPLAFSNYDYQLVATINCECKDCKKAKACNRSVHWNESNETIQYNKDMSIQNLKNEKCVEMCLNLFKHVWTVGVPPRSCRSSGNKSPCTRTNFRRSSNTWSCWKLLDVPSAFINQSKLCVMSCFGSAYCPTGFSGSCFALNCWASASWPHWTNNRVCKQPSEMQLHSANGGLRFSLRYSCFL